MNLTESLEIRIHLNLMRAGHAGSGIGHYIDIS